jgi:AcrR family transcriptional regulator
MTDQSANNDKRSKIIRAAADLFSEKDFHDATVEEVADLAGVGKGTVYLYFPSKENLFVEVIKNGVLQLVDEVEQGLRGIDDTSDKIRRLIEIDLEFVKKHESFYRTFARGEVQIRSLLTEDPAMQFELLSHHLDLITEIIQEGVDKGRFRQIDTYWAAMALQGIILRFSLMYVVGSLKGDLIDTKDTIASLFLGGIESTGG